MKKIPTLFVRDPDNRAHVINEVTPGCEWVFKGEGIARRKYDGTCMMYDPSLDGWYSRRMVKLNKYEPEAYIEVDYDNQTHTSIGWEPVEQSSFYKFFKEAVARQPYWIPGTYELIGPKINGDPERFGHHALIRHAEAEVYDIRLELSYQVIREILSRIPEVEGIVWHHQDGRMAKIKGRDFV